MEWIYVVWVRGENPSNLCGLVVHDPWGDTADVSLVIVITFMWLLLHCAKEHVACLILYNEVVYGLFPYGSGSLV